ncbi:pantoate kinase [Natronomonas pharaonis DSM 2160]|uniref:Pantoate kinase n=1 Tax=Natronomonas pharaonis (strain ATCC 35678 / DSM 2160 / CIP 103997 / JCM 8858 / NBRC 14720 / NCIMB 2260 / Gabara) TaxID=348780 RepID=A0A1U7EU77_NATPD|nr:pantoate kinase [Natronomonas pharaonis]CAI48513.1 pantoate kinase [Natronomonas pharaonis DSM 2160]
MTDAATAFVPGHITGFFSAHPDDDPTKAGSRGAGVALDSGVTVRLEPGDGVELNGESADIEAVDRVLGALRATARVVVETDLPVSAGFGVSGGAALGTALAANAVFDRGLSENELVTIAHGAEVQAGTGLGDVVAQARGGFPVRLEPGAPAHGAMDGIPAVRDIEYVTFGELSTADVLSDNTDELTAAGQRALSSLVAEPTVETFMEASRRFAREAGLLTPPVEEAIESVADADGEASMAMLGETVFALDGGLSAAGYDATQCAVCLPGAHL